MRKIKVSYLGLNSLFGRVTTNLLKQSPCIHKLTLYDDGAPAQAIEHPSVFFGRDSLQDAIKDVDILVIGDEGGGVQEEDRLRVIGSKVIRYTEAILKFSPNAIVIVAATPLNILFPLISSFLGPDWQDRLFGTTSIDTLRASRTLDGLLNEPQSQTHILPVIGGASHTTRVPLFSHVCPQITVSNDFRCKILEKMAFFDGSDSQEMNAIERAYTTVRFIHSVLAGMTGDASVPEIAMTTTPKIPQARYFSLPILIGRKGIERAADLPKLDAFEEKLFLDAAQQLSEESLKAAHLSKQISEENCGESIGEFSVTDPQAGGFQKQSAGENFLELLSAELPSGSSSMKAPTCQRHIPKYDASIATETPVIGTAVTGSVATVVHNCDDSVDENADSDFSETLQLDVEAHLSSLKHNKKPSGMTVNGVEAEGTSRLECSAASDNRITSSKEAGTAETSSTAFKRIDTAILNSKPVKFRSNPAKSTHPPIPPPVSSSAKIDSAIVDSRKTLTTIDNKIVLDLVQLEDKDAKRELRPDSVIEKSSKSNKNIQKMSQTDVQRLQTGDAKKELRPRDNDSTANVNNSTSSLEKKISDRSKPQGMEIETANTEMTADAKRELRPRNHSDKPKRNNRKRITARGRVNLQVLDTFKPESSGENISKSERMLMKRKRKREKKADKTQQVVGVAGKAIEGGESKIKNEQLTSNRRQDKGENTSDDADFKDSETNPSNLEARDSGKTSGRDDPLRRSPAKRKRNETDKIIFNGKRGTPDRSNTAESKDASTRTETTAVKTSAGPNVPASTPKRINSAIANNKARNPSRRAQSRSNNSSNRQRSGKPSDKKGSLPAKRVDDIADVKTPRQRSPTPKAVKFEPSHKQPDVGSHVLTDAARVVKLKATYQANIMDFSHEKITENRKAMFEDDFIEDVKKKSQDNENNNQIDKFPTRKAKPSKFEQPPSKEADEAEQNVSNTEVLPIKDSTPDDPMNYFMQQRRAGPIGPNNLKYKVEPLVSRPKHKKKESVKETDKLKKQKRSTDKTTKDDAKMNENSLQLNYSKQPDKVVPRKRDITKKDNEQDPEDPWDSKYFTKASEMFFKMFRDTVSNPSCRMDERCIAKSHIIPSQPQSNPARPNPDTQGANLQKHESQFQAARNTSKTPKDGTLTAMRNSDKNTSHLQCKAVPGKLDIRNETSGDVKCKLHPEALTKTSDKCGNVAVHVSSLPNNKRSVKEREMPNNDKEAIVGLDKLYEESSTIPVVDTKSNKSWKSVSTNDNMGAKYGHSVLQSVVATSDKGRGDALNKVDYSVCKMQRPNDQGSSTGQFKMPISSKNIKQVSAPSVELTKKPEGDKSYKWERIVNVFRNIIISDIEGKAPKVFQETRPTNMAISTSKSVKPAPSKKPEAKMAPQDGKGVYKVKHKSEQSKKRMQETKQKKRPRDSKQGYTVKNNPKKIVNYFSKRGASASSYDRPDGRDEQPGLLSQTSVNIRQNSTPSGCPTKMK